MADTEFIKKRGEEILEEAGLEGLLDFSFNKLSALKIIKVLYVVGIVLAFLVAVVAILTSMAGGLGSFVAALIVMPIVALVEILFLRVVLEIVVAVFRIDTNLQKLVPKEDNQPEVEE